MLWKKVQHYVVVGGAFVNAAATNPADAADKAAEPVMLQQTQPPKRN
jgi:hypothetical protein